MNQEDRRQSREQTLSLRHSTGQLSKSAVHLAWSLIKKTGGNQEQRRFILAIRRFNAGHVLSRPPNTKFTGHPPIKSDRHKSRAGAPVERLLGHYCPGLNLISHLFTDFQNMSITHLPFNWSRWPEAVKNKDNISSPFDGSMINACYKTMPFKWSRRPEAIKITDAFSSPFDESIIKECCTSRFLIDQENRRQSRTRTYYLGHSTIQC
jgi:hypothetical protein